VTDPNKEISLVDARLYDPTAEDGGKIRKEVTSEKDVNFGRIASQVARQVMFQSVNAIRHSKVLQKFKDSIGEAVNVEIDYPKKGGYVVKLSQTTGFINRENLLSVDRFKSGQIVKALIVDITEDDKGNSRVHLSRTKPEFVSAVIAQEVPEVDSEIVNIDKVVREPGSRTKILVSANEGENIDPVGTILGRKNIRLVNIMRQITSSMQEKIDVVETNWEDLEMMIMDALEPAEIEQVELDEENKVATVYCMPDEAALAVGRSGTNIRLASELLAYEINVESLKDDGSQKTEQEKAEEEEVEAEENGPSISTEEDSQESLEDEQEEAEEESAAEKEKSVETETQEKK
jgi:N utilization substance protein A